MIFRKAFTAAWSTCVCVAIGGVSAAAATVAGPFGGTAILIIVGVGLETVKQIESQLQQRNYEGFLR